MSRQRRQQRGRATRIAPPGRGFPRHRRAFTSRLMFCPLAVPTPRCSHSAKSPQPEASQPVPVLGLGKERLDPHLPLPRSPCDMPPSRAIGAHPVQILLVEVAAEGAPRCRGAAGPERAGGAAACAPGTRSSVGARVDPVPRQRPAPSRTGVDILVRVVGEGDLPKRGVRVVVVREQT